MSGLYLAARDGERVDTKRRKKRSAVDRDVARIVADASRVADMAARANIYGMQILERLTKAIRDADIIAAQALVRHASIEIGAATQMTKNLSEALAPPKSVAQASSIEDRRA